MPKKTQAKGGSAVSLTILGAALTVVGGLVTLHFQRTAQEKQLALQQEEQRKQAAQQQAAQRAQVIRAERINELKKYGEIISHGDVLLSKAEDLRIEVQGMTPSTFSDADIDRITALYLELAREEKIWNGELFQEETVINGVFDGMRPDPLPDNPTPEKAPLHEPADVWRMECKITQWFEGFVRSKLNIARKFSDRLSSEVQHEQL